jgi:hypothetical protein
MILRPGDKEWILDWTHLFDWVRGRYSWDCRMYDDPPNRKLVVELHYHAIDNSVHSFSREYWYRELELWGPTATINQIMTDVEEAILDYGRPYEKGKASKEKEPEKPEK